MPKVIRGRGCLSIRERCSRTRVRDDARFRSTFRRASLTSRTLWSLPSQTMPPKVRKSNGANEPCQDGSGDSPPQCPGFVWALASHDMFPHVGSPPCEKLSRDRQPHAKPFGPFLLAGGIRAHEPRVGEGGIRCVAGVPMGPGCVNSACVCGVPWMPRTLPAPASRPFPCR